MQFNLQNSTNALQVKGLPANQGALYRQDLEEFFRICDGRRTPRIHFEETRFVIALIV
jgi:hypothetical protein